MKVVSYYPNEVTSGTMARVGFELRTVISTDCGTLAFNIDKVPKENIDVLIGDAESRMQGMLVVQ